MGDRVYITPRRDIPQIATGAVAPAAQQPLERMQQEVRRLIGFNGDTLDMAVTFRDLANAGLIQLADNVRPGSGIPPGTIINLGGTPGLQGPPGDPGPPGTGVEDPDFTPPPNVTGLTAATTFAHVIVEWDPAIYTQGHGPAKTRIYAALRNPGDPQAVFSDAVLVYEASHPLTIATLPSALGTRWHLWATFVTVDGVESISPAGGVNGVVVTTGFIGNTDLGPLIVEAANLANGSVTAAALAAGAVSMTAFASGIRPPRVLGALPVLPAAGYLDGDTAVLTTDGKLYRIVAGAWTRAVDGADLVANSITTGSIAAGAVGADQIAANAITTGKLLVTGRGRALNDDPTLTDTSAWTIDAPVSLETGTGLAGSAGNRFFYDPGTGAFDRFVESRRIAIDPAKTYRLQANLSANSGNNRNTYVFVRMWDELGAELDGSDTGWGGTLAGYVYGAVVPSGVWTRVGTNFGAGTPRAIPSNAREVTVGVWFNYNSSGSGHVWQAAQDIRLEESVGYDLIVDGGILANHLAANSIAVGTAAIQNGAIVNAMIANATIDNAKIVSLSASKIIAGSLAVGEYIQSTGFVPTVGSGFRITGDGSVEIRNSDGSRVLHLGASGTQPVLKAGSAFEVLANGSATFSGTVTASSIVGSTVTGGTITGSVIQTSASGQRVVLNESSSNEARFYGDRGDGGIVKLAAIGLTAAGGDFVIGDFGTPESEHVGVFARSVQASAIIGAAYGSFNAGVTGQSSQGGAGVAGTSVNGPGVSGYSANDVGITGTGETVGVSGVAEGSAGTGVSGVTTAGVGVSGTAFGAGYGGVFTGSSKAPLFLTPINNTAMPSGAAPGALAMVRFPAIGGGGGNIRLCYIDQFGVWRYVADNSAI